MYQTIRYEKQENIGILTINRPEALNALNSEVLTDLDELVSTVKADADIRALVITGSGEKAFVAGADIGEMSTLTKEGGEAFGKHGNNVFRAIETLPIPTIAAVNGFALGGGCELSMACDIRICADTAVFGQPETGLGITPGFGGTQRLARLVSPGMAKQLIYTAKNIKADEAYRIGLVNAVYPLDELLPAAVEVVLETGQACVSMLQRRLKLGYSRAARLVDQMEERGYVGPFEGSKPRQLLITREKWQELQMAKGASPAEADKPADRYGSIHDVFESHDALE